MSSAKEEPNRKTITHKSNLDPILLTSVILLYLSGQTFICTYLFSWVFCKWQVPSSTTCLRLHCFNCQLHSFDSITNMTARVIFWIELSLCHSSNQRPTMVSCYSKFSKSSNFPFPDLLFFNKESLHLPWTQLSTWNA